MDKNLLKKIIITGVMVVVGIFVLASIGRICEDVKNETIVVNQFPVSGRMEYWIEPGLHMQWFGRTTKYYKTQQFWFGGSDMSGEVHGSPIKVRFRDGSEGYIYGSLRVNLPTDEASLKKIQTTYNGMDRLMNELIATSAKNAIYTTGSLITAFESYAEKKNELRVYIEDQLVNGIYKTGTSTEEVIDPITGEKKLTTVAILKTDESGNYLHDVAALAKYNIIADQVSITDVPYDEKVVAQIAKQQEANMEIQTAKAEAAKAQQLAIKAEEEGKAEAAKARWEQEKIKAAAVTKAEQDYEVARLEAQKAKEVAKRVEAEGEAKAAANRALVAAGLTPLERANIEKETRIGVAEALAKTKWPTVVMSGGNGQNSAMDVIALKQMTDLVDKMSK